MPKWGVRLLMFLVGFPTVIGLTFLETGRHLTLNVLTTIVSVLCTYEVAQLLRSKGFRINRFLLPFFGALFPFAAYLEVLGWLESHHTLLLMLLLISAILLRQIFSNQEQEIQEVLHKVTGNLFVLIYPGFFFYFFVKISGLDLAVWAYMAFVFMTYGNDSMAFVFGSLWGRQSRKLFTVSPNKSLIGFIGGLLVSTLSGLIFQMLFPSLFGPWAWLGALAGLIIGLSTIAGDLFESSLKRSAGAKDSGSLIPGRGGLLDSIDSLLFSAPLFYLYLVVVQEFLIK